jgi:hypothetical protein
MRKALAFVCALAMAAPLSAAAAGWSSSSVSRPASPLTAGLGGGTWSELTAKFDARLHHRFQPGVAEKDLTEELAREGFRRVSWRGPDGAEVAERREDSFACNIAARVYWRADAAGRVQTLRGEYRQEGCL